MWQPLPHSPAWIDRTGKEERVAIPPAGYSDPRVSLRGNLLMSTGGYSSRRLVLHEPGLNEPRQLPWGRTAFTPAWAPDNLHVAFV